MLQISQSISPEEAVQPMEIQQVIQLYQQLIYGIALTGTGGNRADAEDVFQETFLAYFQANKIFREEEHRKAWLIRTACNYCKKITGSTYRKRTVPLTDTTPLPVLFDLPEDNQLFAALWQPQADVSKCAVSVLLCGISDRRNCRVVGKTGWNDSDAAAPGQGTTTHATARRGGNG